MYHQPISPIVCSSECVKEKQLEPTAADPQGLIVDDQLEALLHVEQTYRVDHIPCRNTPVLEGESSQQRLPHEEWRRKITEWSYRVVDHFRIDRLVVSVAMNYFDRYLCKHKKNQKSIPGSSCQCPSCQRAVDSRTFQLAAMTCLYLAIKLHAENAVPDQDPSRRYRRKKIKIISFVDLSRGQFTPQDLTTMEISILETLKWKVNPPTSSLMVSYLLQRMPARHTVSYPARCHYDLVLHVLNELARYLSELSVCLSNISSTYLPSEIAFASILVSMDMLTLQALPVSVQNSFCDSIAAVSEGNLAPTSNSIRYLMGRLRQCFWPEMLLEDQDMEIDHPIAMAKAAGLLDLSHLCPKQLGRNPSATSVMQVPGGHGAMSNDCTMEETPITVTP